MTVRSVFIFLAISLLSLSACEEKRESQVRPYMAKTQPRFYMNGQIEHLKRDNEVVERIILIGDAGNGIEQPATADLIKAISKRLNSQDTEESIVFLGDNIYPDGFQGNKLNCGNDSADAKILETQLFLGKATMNPSFFVPGNHDWDYHDEPDISLIQKQKDYVEKCGRDTQFVPAQDNKPALVSVLEKQRYNMVFLDSHAIMNASGENQKQAYNMIEGVFKLTDTAKPVIMVMHHPLATHGPHGGCYQQDYFGHSIINFFRRQGISWGQDINDREYAAFIARLNTIIPDTSRVILASGHDHSLQVLQLEKGADFQLVSGTGSHTDPVCVAEDTLFAQESMGHIEIAFREEGQLTVEVFSFKPDTKALAKVYSQRLF